MATATNFHQVPGFVPNSSAQYSPPPAIQSQSRIAYFITRTNGTPVPLIPADELPYNVKLQHVPRVLTPDQTYGLHYVGNSPYTGNTFRLEKSSSYNNNMHRFDCQPAEENSYSHGPCNAAPRQFQAPDSMVRQSIFQDSTRAPPPSRPVSAYETSKSWRRSDPVNISTPPPVDGTDATQNAINAILRSQAGAETAERIGYRSHDSTPPPSGKMPDQEKKEWCTYWILHGDCAYVQQGCRYRHEMPDKAKLAEIGIHHVPRWWLEQNSAIKLGGDRTTLGPVVKPEVWLKSRKGSDADSESSSTDSASTQSEKPPTPPKVILQREVTPKPSPKIMPARPSTPTELLINFVPLVPTPSTASSSRSDLSSNTAISSPPSSQEKIVKHSSPVVSTLAPIRFDRPAKPTNIAASNRSPSKATAKPARIFVPAGESPEVHIADAKKRAVARNKASRTPSPTIKASKTGENLEKLIGEMRKAKVGSPPGSIHVPTQQSMEPMKRKARTGCRERRPVSSPITHTVQVAKK